jgi:uncharacterized Tic20 family protein
MLRGGATLEVWADHVIAATQAYPMSELTGAAGVTAAPAQPGLPGVPAIALRRGAGEWTTFVPADPLDAQRALDALYTYRPDLRAAPARSSAFAGSPSGLGRADTVLAGLAHLSVLFAPLLLPLIIWLAMQPTSPYSARQAKQAFFFHLGVIALLIILLIVLAVVAVVALGVGLASGNTNSALPGIIIFPLGGIVVAGLAFTAIGLSIYGAIQAFQGRPFSYPFLQRL